MCYCGLVAQWIVPPTMDQNILASELQHLPLGGAVWLNELGLCAFKSEGHLFDSLVCQPDVAVGPLNKALNPQLLWGGTH